MPSNSVASIAKALVECVSADAEYDLRFEEPKKAIERHFAPLKARALPRRNFVSDACSTDGWYVSGDEGHPWIFFSEGQSDRRVRFTIAHELGHHLLVTDGSALLDDLDDLAESVDELNALEESVCHQFAGSVLIPISDLTEVVGSDQILPTHVLELWRHGAASLEAIAVRVAGLMTYPGAVLIMGNDSTVGFCASSPGLGQSWWRRGSSVDSAGPLSRAMSSEIQAMPETYRYGLAYSSQLYCDTLPVNEKFGIAVLSNRPSTNTRAVLVEVEPRWKDEERFCEFCITEVRDVGWCDDCKGRHCRRCDSCGCIAPANDPVCPTCRLRSPRRPGALVCRDCE
jgi:uncharacterized protein DUF955